MFVQVELCWCWFQSTSEQDIAYGQEDAAEQGYNAQLEGRVVSHGFLASLLSPAHMIRSHAHHTVLLIRRLLNFIIFWFVQLLTDDHRIQISWSKFILINFFVCGLGIATVLSDSWGLLWLRCYHRQLSWLSLTHTLFVEWNHCVTTSITGHLYSLFLLYFKQ